MASKNGCFFEKVSTGQKIGGAGASISCAAFEKEGHFCGHSERMVIIISERWEGICYKSLTGTFSADCLMFNWCHIKKADFEHQTAGTRRRRANTNLL